jgi:hypothetical protein
MSTETLDLRAAFDRAERVQRFWDDHWAEYLEKYPDEFVAVRDGEVVATNSDLALLYYELRDLGLKMSEDVDVELIRTNWDFLIL